VTNDSQANATGPREAEAGFTLVELLVALSLFTFISLALFEGLHFGVFAWGRGREHADRADHVLYVQNLLRRLIEDAYPLYLSSDPTHGHVDFDGTAVSLGFLASAPIVLGGGGRSRFKAFVDQSRGRHDLVLTSQPELADEGDAVAATKTMLLADVESVDFSYLGQTRLDKSRQWRDSWAREPILPNLVRVRIRFPRHDARAWPDLDIAPRISADVGCAYDPLNKGCRGR
jgi:general secretion pathway protein J